jgi:hypothetical protein
MSIFQASDHELSAEVKRRLKVEESWGRRKVVAELHNAERLEHYESKKALWRCFPGEVSPLRGAAVSSAEIIAFKTKG